MWNYFKSIRERRRNKLIYRWLGVTKDNILLEEEKEWLSEQWENKGFQSYMAYRDLSILKEMGAGLEWDMYRNYLGRRKEVLFLAAEAKKQWEERELKNKLNKINVS